MLHPSPASDLIMQTHSSRPANTVVLLQGMITLWDVEGGLPQLDKYLYSNDQAVVAGALLGVGIVNANVRVRSPCSVTRCCIVLHSEAAQ